LNILGGVILKSQESWEFQEQGGVPKGIWGLLGPLNSFKRDILNGGSFWKLVGG